MKKPLIMICLALIALAGLANATSRCESATFGATGGAMRLVKREKCRDSDQNGFTRRVNVSDISDMVRQLTRCVVETLECRQLLSAAVVPITPAMGLSDQALAQVVVASARIGPGVYGGTAAGGPVTILPPGTNSPLSVPAYNLTAAAPNSSTVVLSWSGNSDNSMKFIILRQPAGSQDWTNIASVPGGLRTYTDPNVAPGASYTYRIVTTNRAGGEVTASNLATISTRVPPPAVTNLTTTVMTATSVQLNWNDASPDVTHFQIQRQLGSAGAWVPLNNAPATAKQYTDTTASASTSYNYRVIAINNFGGAAAANVVAAATAPMLTPGTGFAGPTAQPADTGTPGQLGWGENAIARWDVVPYQTFTGLFNVGVVAFDISGIKEVDFSVNGGPWTAVTKMTLNPQTANHTGVGNPSDGVVEYWATLNAADFADGQIEVRAIAVPNVGVARVLQGAQYSYGSANDGQWSLPLYADAHNSLPQIIRYVSITGSDTTGDGSASKPFATIYEATMSISANGTGNADNGVIYLDPGDYNYAGAANRWPLPKTVNSWLTIAAAPGVDYSQVRLTGSGNTNELNATLIHLENLTVTSSVSSANSPACSLWFDDVSLAGSGRTADIFFAQSSAWTGGIYMTNVLIQDAGDSVWGIQIARNTSAINIGQHAFNHVALLINCTAANISDAGTTFHPDALYYDQKSLSNVIIYGFTATQSISAQGLAIGERESVAGPGTYMDYAIVNTDITNSGYRNMQVMGPWENLFIDNSSFQGGSSIFRPDLEFTAIDVVVENTNFSSGPGDISGVVYK